MKRVLFVDDEQGVLDGLRVALRKYRAAWQMDFAVSADVALDKLAEQPFDVVVTDMQMPRMDGPALLAQIQAEYPQTTRIVLSGHANEDAILRAVPVSHQYLAKPCSVEVLAAVIERTCTLREKLADERLKALIGKLDRLPTPSHVYRDLVAALGEEDTSIRRIAGIVEGDPALAAKALQLVNSSYFGLASRVVSVERAVGYLGVDIVRSLALTEQLFSSVPKVRVSGYDPAALQVRSLLTARVAKRLAGDDKIRDEAFTSALLLDVGELVLLMVAADTLAKTAASAEPGSPKYVREQVALGVSHAEVGAYLLGLWGLPRSIVEAVAYHHQPAALAPTEGLDSVALVHVAAEQVSRMLAGTPQSDDGGLDAGYLAAAGVDACQLAEWERVSYEEVRLYRERVDGQGD
ncbi:MAG: HDOD domain-containing protein [Myxococcales bacterium]|nr:HDOD domain-containing protein [Myxococcales bacterium]